MPAFDPCHAFSITMSTMCQSSWPSSTSKAIWLSFMKKSVWEKTMSCSVRHLQRKIAHKSCD